MAAPEPLAHHRPVQSCPVCGALADRESVRPDDGAFRGDYCCPLGHIWITRWVVTGP